MKFNDDITLDIASSVKNVMEGKPAPVKFNVVDEDGKVVKGFNTKEAANKYVVDNRDKQVLNITVAEVEEPRVPDGNMGSKMGERGFKVSNIPLVPHQQLPADIFDSEATKVGLVIDPTRLSDVRKTKGRKKLHNIGREGRKY